jgi:oligoribonuclease NrnB/cAMP/cGMP phosphodiesterase (DHH superfamily)
MIVLTDADADGIFSAALVEYVFGDSLDVQVVPVGPHKPILRPGEAIDELAKYAKKNLTVWFLDTSLDSAEEWMISDLPQAAENTRIHFFDHHEWSNENRKEYVREHTEYFELDCLESKPWELPDEVIEERCTTQMVYDYFTASGIEFPDEIKHRVKGVNVGDLWIKNDDGEFKHPLTQPLTDSVEFVTDINREHRLDEPWYGYKKLADAFLDTKTAITNSVIDELADKYHTKIQEKVDFVLQNSDELVTSETVNGITYTAVYANIAPNEISEILRENGSDVVAVVFPHLRVSFRGKENTFEKCHKIAEDLGGGGHKMASGAGLYDLNPYATDKEFQEDNGEKVRRKLITELQQY